MVQNAFKVECSTFSQVISTPLRIRAEFRDGEKRDDIIYDVSLLLLLLLTAVENQVTGGWPSYGHSPFSYLSLGLVTSSSLSSSSPSK